MNINCQTEAWADGAKAGQLNSGAGLNERALLRQFGLLSWLVRRLRATICAWSRAVAHVCEFQPLAQYMMIQFQAEPQE